MKQLITVIAMQFGNWTSHKNLTETPQRNITTATNHPGNHPGRVCGSVAGILAGVLCADILLICFLFTSRHIGAPTNKNMPTIYKPAIIGQNKDSELSPAQSELSSVMNQGDDSQPLNASENPIETARDTFGAFVGGDGQGLQDALPAWAGDFCGVHEEKLEINGDMMAVAMLGSQSGFVAAHVTGDASGTPVPSILQIMVSAPRSGGKSRAFDVTTGALYEMQTEGVRLANNVWVDMIRPQIILRVKQIEVAKKKMEGNPSDLETAEHIADLEHEVEALNRRPETKERYIMDNSTGPARNMMLAEAHRNAVFLLTPDARFNLRRMLDGRPAEREEEIQQILKGFSGDPLIANRVTEKLRREAPHQWLSALLGVQPDLAEKFWADPLLRKSGVHSRVQCFNFGPSPTTRWRNPDDEVRRVQTVWREHLTRLDAFKRQHLGEAPIEIEFTPEALERLVVIDHPFGAGGWDENSLQAALSSRWREVAMRWALNLALMKYDGGDLPEVGATEIDSACTFLFRAHRDAVGLAGVAARSPDQVAQDDLVRHLAVNGGQMALASGNPLGLSVGSLERLVGLNPERLRIAPVSDGGRGRPRKHVLLNA